MSPAPYPGPRWLSFSGYDWWVKTSAGQVGPGPNYFSDSTNNVWLDGQGQLHLRITNRSNQWQCAELVSARTFGYGSYRFQLASPADNLNPNAVLGLFTWSDDPAYADREIDIECSRWGNAADPNNAQFVVQPYDLERPPRAPRGARRPNQLDALVHLGDQPRELPKPARQLLAQSQPGQRHQQLDLRADRAANRRRKRPPQPVALQRGRADGQSGGGGCHLQLPVCAAGSAATGTR